MYNPIQFFEFGKARCKVNFSDIDAAAFLTAASISDSTQQTAIYTLVSYLKCKGLWSKMLAIYPFIGGTESTHKWNLKDPRDLNIAYRLVFSGGWTHSSNGSLPNGTNGYANTFLTPSGLLNVNNSSLSYYSRTLILQSVNIDIGASNSAASTSTLAIGTPRTSMNGFYSSTGQTNSTDYASPLIKPSSAGYFIGTRISSSPSDLKIIYNGNIAGIATTNTGGYDLPSVPLYIAAFNYNNSSTLYFSNKECAFAHVGSGLTDYETLVLNNIVQNYQIILGRNV